MTRNKAEAETLKMLIRREAAQMPDFKKLERYFHLEKDALLETQRRILELLSDFRVGDQIEWGSRRGKTRRGRVLKIHPWMSGGTEVVLHVRSIRKDGSEGQICQVYPWMDPKVNEPVATKSG